jgi:hypothetical protein
MSDNSENKNKLVVATVTIPITFWTKSGLLEKDLIKHWEQFSRTGLEKMQRINPKGGPDIREETFTYTVFAPQRDKQLFLDVVKEHRESMRQHAFRWTFGQDCGYVVRPEREEDKG